MRFFWKHFFHSSNNHFLVEMISHHKTSPPPNESSNEFKSYLIDKLINESPSMQRRQVTSSVSNSNGFNGNRSGAEIAPSRSDYLLNCTLSSSNSNKKLSNHRDKYQDTLAPQLINKSDSKGEFLQLIYIYNFLFLISSSYLIVWF